MISTTGTLASASPYLQSLLKPCPSLAIVGTAGRKEDKDKLSGTGATIFDRMVEIAAGAADKLQTVTLVSGGAAWADHVAVALFLREPTKYKLQLHLPCDFTGSQYQDNGAFGSTNPGGTANHYHRAFSKETGRNSLDEIRQAITAGAETKSYRGFLARNLIVAKSDGLIAFTFGNKDEVKDGGTAHTVKEHLKLHPQEPMTFHVDLHEMKTYLPAVVK